MNNELKHYKIVTFQTWAEIEEKTGFSKKKLIRIASLEDNDILKLSINTYYVLKKTLGIDLLKNIWKQKM